MIRGAEVTVLRPGAPTRDRFGNDVPGEAVSETVPGVVIAPGATADMEASRPEGVTVAYTLHFPKTYTATLEGCSVTLPAPWGGTSAWSSTASSPGPMTTAFSPSRWT